jgi:hypothetical protein
VNWKRAARRCTVALALAATAFGVTSYAFGAVARTSQAPPTISSSLGVAKLPQSTVPSADVLRINDLLGTHAGDYGISMQSFDEARVVGSTSVGPLYFIPGSNGECLALSDAVECGNPGSPSGGDIGALFVTDPKTNTLVGGGIAVDGIASVTVGTPNGSRTLPVVNGTFAALQAAEIKVSNVPARFIANKR